MKNLPNFLAIGNAITLAAHHFVAARQYFCQNHSEGRAAFCKKEEKELWCLLEKVNKYICHRGGQLDKKEAVPAIPMQWSSFQQVFDLLHTQQKNISVVIERNANALAGANENTVDVAFITGLFHEHLKELAEIGTMCDHMFATPEQSNIDWDRYLLKEYGGDE